MGNTAMRPVSFKLPRALDEQLTRLARRRRTTRSAVVREALEALEAHDETSSDTTTVTEAAADLVGVLSGPRDLSRSRRHMTGYGR